MSVPGLEDVAIWHENERSGGAVYDLRASESQSHTCKLQPHGVQIINLIHACFFCSANWWLSTGWYLYGFHCITYPDYLGVVAWLQPWVVRFSVTGRTEPFSGGRNVTFSGLEIWSLECRSHCPRVQTLITRGVILIPSGSELIIRGCKCQPQGLLR